jgi:hypothetical protein
VPASLATDALFEQYVAAKNKADRTNNLADGLAAGHAWAAFLDSFTRETAP